MNSAQPLTALINCILQISIRQAKSRLPGKVKEHIPEKEICYAPDLQALVRELYEDARPGDMIFTMGAGNIYQAGEALIQLIREKGLADDYKK